MRRVGPHLDFKCSLWLLTYKLMLGGKDEMQEMGPQTPRWSQESQDGWRGVGWEEQEGLSSQELSRTQVGNPGTQDPESLVGGPAQGEGVGSTRWVRGGGERHPAGRCQ